MITQSVGVPLTAKCRSATSRRRSGSLSDNECDTPDWSLSGATIQISSDSLRAIFSQASRPGAWMPSSLVMRMRMEWFYRLVERMASSEWRIVKAPSYSLLAARYLGHAAHIGLERLGHHDRALVVLIGLHHRDQRAADRDAGAVERVDVAFNFAVLAFVTRLHPLRLELATVGARRNLAIGVLARQPDLDVVGLL